MKLLFITGNEHKLREAQEILGENVEGRSLDLLEIQSLDPKAIIKEKLREARARVPETDVALIVEDTSFWIGDLGFPGPLFKFMLKSLEREGVVRFAEAFGHEKAEAICEVGILFPEKEEAEFFTGRVGGRIVTPRGESGFGFDPIFIPNGEEKSFAEMSASEKNSISHRRKALVKVASYLSEQ